MLEFIEFSENPRGWSGSYLSRVARRALAVVAVVGAGAGMMSAQSNFAASGVSDPSGPAYSSSAAEQTEALVVAPLPDFSKIDRKSVV